MRILAIDATQSSLALGLFEGAGLVPLAELRRDAASRPVDAVVPEIGRLMAAAGWAFSALDRIAVTVGPGSFTGVRAGVAAARGIALGCGRPAIGISSLAAFAAPFLASDDPDQVLIAAIDARHGSIFAQGFGADGKSAFAPACIAIADAARLFLSRNVLAVGTGATQLVAEIWSGGGRAKLGSAAAEPDLGWVARLAAAAPEDAGARPLYLKKPDAKPQDGKGISRR